MSASTHDRPKVLYIAGWGRSGTTLLDNLVGSHHGVFTAGEVTRMWELSFGEGRLCGCGVPLLDCELWRAVFDRAFGPTPPDPQRMLELQRTAIPVWRTPELVASVRRGRVGAGAAEYADVLSRLYRAIAAETGADVIVDASKRPPDAVATVSSIDGSAVNFQVTTEARPVPRPLLEKVVTEQLTTAFPAARVTCGGDLAPQVGRIQTCTVTRGGREFPVTTTVTEVRGALVDFSIRPP